MSDLLIDMKPHTMTPFHDYEMIQYYVAEQPPDVQILTHAFLDDIFLSKKRLFTKYPNDKYNYWIAKRLIQYGDIGQGKTTFCRWLLQEANKRYGKENVTLYYSRSNFAQLLEEHPEKPWRTPVIILFDDDCTMEKLSRETVKQFVRMRHLAFERTGLNRGLIIGIIGVHRFHAGDLLFRTKFHGFIVRDCPSNKYDYDFLKNYFSEAALDTVGEIENLREKDDQYYGWAIFKTGNWEGIIINKKPRIEDLTNWVDLSKLYEEKKQIERVKFEIPNLMETQIDIIKAAVNHFPEIIRKYPQLPHLAETLEFWANMMLNQTSYGDTGQRTVMWRRVKRYSEQVGEAIEYAWGTLNPGYRHIAGNGRVDYMKKDGTEWVEIKWRSTDPSWSPRPDNLSREARELLEKGVPGRCIVIAYIPRKSQHTENKLVIKEYPFKPQPQQPRNDPSFFLVASRRPRTYRLAFPLRHLSSRRSHMDVRPKLPVGLFASVTFRFSRM